MTEKKSTDERIIEFLGEKGTGTVDEICAALGISRTNARKYLAGLTVDKKVKREAGGERGGENCRTSSLSQARRKRPANGAGRPLRNQKTGASLRGNSTNWSSASCGRTRTTRRTRPA